MERSENRCPDCESGITRRDFVAGAAAAVAAGSLTVGTSQTFAAPSPKSSAETAVKELYATLTDEQRKEMALSIDDSRRRKINANWHVTDAKVGSFSKAQQEIIHQIVKGATSEDGYERFLKQMENDHHGITNYAVAIFGDPNGDKFEFELTGRHLTLRADGNTLDGMAFGGPIVYGHAAKGNSKRNLFSYQTMRANEVFKALDGKQQEVALLDKAPRESQVQLRDNLKALPGIACSDLSGDQKDLVEATLKDIMRPYRKEDVDEVMQIVKAGGGLDEVRISFYKNEDLDDDKVWDVWRLEGPTLVCHFRGAPHVHAYINVAERS